jgi:glutaredoxin 3
MSKVRIYTTPICPYCVRAKSLLKKKGADVEEIDVFMNCEARAEMEAMAEGRRTVPQIFIGETHVGGCDDLFDLERAGELDPLLKAG